MPSSTIRQVPGSKGLRCLLLKKAQRRVARGGVPSRNVLAEPLRGLCSVLHEEALGSPENAPPRVGRRSFPSGLDCEIRLDLAVVRARGLERHFQGQAHPCD